MGIDRNRFKCDIDEDLHICSLCNDVFDDPVVIIRKCQDSFCRKCLEHKLEEESKRCPIEGCDEVIGDGDWTNNKMLEKLLGKLQLTCSFTSNGCDQVIALSSLSTHTNECRHNPDNLAEPCVDGCGTKLTKQQVKSHTCVLAAKNKEIDQLKEQLKSCQLEKNETKSTIDGTLKKAMNKIEEMEKSCNENQKKIEELKSLLKNVSVNKIDGEQHYMAWLSKFSESGNEDHRRYVQVLKEKKLIADWRLEAVMMRCQAKHVQDEGGYGSLKSTSADYCNWFMPTILSLVKDNLQLGSSFLYYDAWGYLTFAAALMVGPNGRAFTNYDGEKKCEDYMRDIRLKGEGIFNQINIDIEKKKLMAYDDGKELIDLTFDCIFFKYNGDICNPIEFLKDRLKPGGRMITYKFGNYLSFELIEKLSDGTFKQSVLKKDVEA